MRRAASFLVVALAVPAAALAAPKPQYSPELDRQYDLGLERLYAKDFATAAGRLHAVYRGLPETELKREQAQFHLANALRGMGLVQGATELYIDVITGRRSPELVGRALGVLEELVRAKQLDEQRLIDQVLFGNQFGDLPPDTMEFVQYYQGLGELRRGYHDWGQRRLEELAKSDEYYGLRARFALGVERLSEGNEAGAEKILRALMDDPKAPGGIRNDARLAIARISYERKKYQDAFDTYAKIDSPLSEQDVVLLEKAWNQLADRDERKALGLVMGLGAPVYRRLFAPERALLRALALKRLCQFRAARLTVTEFRKKYRATLQRVRERKSLLDDAELRNAVMRRDDLLPTRKWRDRLEVERTTAQNLPDQELSGFLRGIYDTKLALAQVQLGRHLEKAIDRLASELLLVDEQMSILDYELGIELFKRIGDEGVVVREGGQRAKVPAAGSRAYFRFNGEYWSDEIHDLQVLVEDRCVR